MKYIIKCDLCGSKDLKRIDIIFGKGTNGERCENGFKCNKCGSQMALDEISFESEVEQ